MSEPLVKQGGPEIDGPKIEKTPVDEEKPDDVKTVDEEKTDDVKTVDEEKTDDVSVEASYRSKNLEKYPSAIYVKRITQSGNVISALIIGRLSSRKVLIEPLKKLVKQFQSFRF